MVTKLLPLSIMSNSFLEQCSKEQEPDLNRNGIKAFTALILPCIWKQVPETVLNYEQRPNHK
jgi:hypothetical protein